MGKRTEPFTDADCCRTMYQAVPNGGLNNEGLVAILKLEILKPEFQKPEYQLFRLSGGFGCRPSSGGNACFGRYCDDGEYTREEQFNFIGIANEETTRFAEELESKWQQEKKNEAEM